MAPPVVVATHGHCFDGMASAVLFTHLLRSVDPRAKGADFVYRGQAYVAGKSGVDPATFDQSLAGAILDFRFSPIPGLAWYFDHHASAFPTNADRAAFDALADEGRGFYDPFEGSCTQLLADVSRQRFGVDVSPFEQLVHWADMIDSAAFPSAQMVVERKAPELKLLAVVEQQGNDKLLTDLVGRLLVQPLSDVAAAPDLVARYAGVQRAYDKQVERIRKREERRGDVVFVDLLEHETETVTKFVTYADVPDAPYSVIASRSDGRCKISVGYNPWSGTARRHDICVLCERYGGGGHPVVGAIALPKDLDACRRIALEIVELLNGPGDRADPTSMK